MAEILQVSLNPLKQTFTMAETLQVSLNPLQTNYYYGRNTPSKS